LTHVVLTLEQNGHGTLTSALRFHDLRHTAARRVGDASADAFTLAAIFGWSDIRMAMTYMREKTKGFPPIQFHVTGA